MTALDEFPGLASWLAAGERGMSSETIVSRITGIPITQRRSAPYDTGDFRRCEMLLRAAPSLRDRLGEMRAESPHWAHLVDCWQTITETMEREAPGCFQRRYYYGNAPAASAIIRSAWWDR